MASLNVAPPPLVDDIRALPSTFRSADSSMAPWNDVCFFLSQLSRTPLQPDRGAGPPSPGPMQAPNGTLPSAARVTDNPESPRRPPKPPQMVKPRQQQAKTPKPPPQTSHALAAAPRPHPDSQRPALPAEETQRRGDGKTLFNLNHLFSLKEKIHKLPTQSKRGGASSSTRTRKSSG